MSAVVNPLVAEAAVPPVSHEAAAFHATLEGHGPTPVHDLRTVAAELGLRAVLMKDESHRLGLPAFKILGASWAVERALRDQRGVRALVAASAGNHGRAVARVAGQRGLACRVFLPLRSLPARRFAIESEGAEVVVVDGTYEDAVAQAIAAGDDPGALLVSDVGTSGPPEWVIDGYATLFDEATAQARYDLIIVPVGVGALAAAAARHGAEVGSAVVGVEPARAACLTASLAARRPVEVPTPGTAMAGLDCARVSPAAWPSLRAGLRGALTIEESQATAAVTELAALGHAIGESGAAALAGLRRLMSHRECAELRADAIADPAACRVLLIATEGPTASAQRAS